MIESIHIKNFRGIQDGKIDRFSKINLLVGPNNSGKSAIIETIYLSNTASRPAIIQRQNHEFDGLTASRDIAGNDPLERVTARHAKQITTKLTDNILGGMLRKDWGNLNLILHTKGASEKESCHISLFSLKGARNYPNHSDSLHEMIGDSDWGSITTELTNDANKESLITLFWESALTYFQSKESAWIINGINPSAKKTLLYDVITSLSHVPFEYYRQMLSLVPGWTHKIAKSFERIFQLNQKYNVTFLQLQHDLSQTQGFIAPEDKVALTIDDYGDGSRSAFKLLTPLIALTNLATETEPGLFLWEEPEIFQNPLTLGRLLEEIALLIKDKPVQLFIATHSLDVIAQFTALVESGQIEHDDLMTFRLNLQEGQLTSSWFNVDNLKAWMEEGLDPRVWGEFKSPLQFRFQEEGE